MTVHDYVKNYRFEFDGGGTWTPTDHERAMIEDAIEGYLASGAKADVKGHPVALVGSE